jgi:SAM-dependent methyltransferase
MQYDALAPIYDRLMDFVEYDEWIELIVKTAARFGTSDDPQILELGAGTGVVGAALSGMGYRYIASDLSFPMCKEARSKRGLAACAADARYLPFKREFDIALFLYDGINYLLAMDDYRRLFASVYNVLVPGGLFLFDITTRENSVRHFLDYLDFEDYGDVSFVRHSYFDAGKSIQHNDFTIYRQIDVCRGVACNALAPTLSGGGKNESCNTRGIRGVSRNAPTDNNPSGDDDSPRLYEKHIESHRQKIFSVEEIERVIPKKRFETLGIWDGYTFRKYSARSERIHFLLRRVGGI